MVEVGNMRGEDYTWHGYDLETIQWWIDLAHDEFPGTDWKHILTIANQIWKNLPK